MLEAKKGFVPRLGTSICPLYQEANRPVKGLQNINTFLPSYAAEVFLGMIK
jgi:hypothetical protein